jgi:hypothetical protein
VSESDALGQGDERRCIMSRWKVLTVLTVALVAFLATPAASALPSGTESVTYQVTDLLGHVLTPRSGWYRREVVVRWKVEPAPSSTTGCEPAVLIAFETEGQELTCSAEWASSGMKITKTTVPAIKIDWTPPSSVRARARRPPDLYGWYDHRIRFVFRGRDALSGIARCSRRSYSGPNTGRASITGLCKDAAGNIRKRTIRFRYSNPLLLPRPGTRFRRAPLLNWVRVPRARFYNVQVWRDGGKILTRWPQRTRLRMPTLWTHEGLTYALSAGRYDVYVWPRFRGRYGKSIGHTYFIRR